MTNARHWSEQLKTLGTCCTKAMDWAARMPDPETAWAECNEPAWMLWVAGELCDERGSARHRQLVLATCACVRLVLPSVPHGEERPRRAIELAEAWARRKPGVTPMMVRRAADEAYHAADDAYADAAEEAYAHPDAETSDADIPELSAARASAYAAYFGTCAEITEITTDPFGVAAYDDAAAAAAEYAGINLEEFRESCLRIIRRMLPDVPKWFEEYKL